MAGPWSVYPARAKSTNEEVSSKQVPTSLHLLTTPQVSVFVFDKKRLEASLAKSGAKGSGGDVYERLRREVASLTKLRHPYLLKLIVPLEESKNSMRFVTEPLFSNLQHMIELNSSNVGSSAIEGFELDELAIQKGLLQVSEALDFLHGTANSVHLDIQPSSVLINNKGDWKLFGLGFVETFTKEAANEYFIPRFDPRLPAFIQINFDYAAPELVLDRKLDPANDIFSLGCLLITLFLHRPPMRSDNNSTVYKQEFQNVNRLLHDSRIPQYLHDLLPQMMARYPANRVSLAELKNSPLFDNILIRTINFLDDFPAKLPAEQQAFMAGFSKLVDQFPKSVLQKKILPAFLEELGKEETLVGPILSNIFIIGKDMSQLGFSEKILPAIRKVKDVLSAKVAILSNIDILTSRVKGDSFRDVILPIVLDTIENAPPEIQEVALQKVPIYVEKLDFVTLKNDVFPVVGSVFAKTTSLAVKLEALRAFEQLVKSGLDKYAATEKLLPLLSSMKTREPSVMMGALRVYSSVVPIIEVEVLARQVIPQLLNMSMESMLNHAQFREFMEEIHKVLDRVEKEHGKRLSQVQVHANGAAAGALGGDVNGGAAQGADAGPMNFEDLVFGKGKKPAAASSNSSSNTPVVEHATITIGNGSGGPKPLSSTNMTSTFGVLKLEPSAPKPAVSSSFAPMRPLSPPPPMSTSSSSTAAKPPISWSSPAPSVGGFGSTGAFSAPLAPSTGGGFGGSSSGSTFGSMAPLSAHKPTTATPAASVGIDWGSNKPASTSSSSSSGPSASTAGASPSSGAIDWSRAVKPKPVTASLDSSFGDFHGSSPLANSSSNSQQGFGSTGGGGFGMAPLAPMKPQQGPPALGFSLASTLTPMSASTSSPPAPQPSFGFGSSSNNDDSLI